MTWVHWALLSAVFAGLTAVLAKAGVKDLQPDLATAIRTAVVFLLALAIAAARSTQSLSSISAPTWTFLTLSGLATGGSWLCYFRALQLGPASQVAPVDKLSVVFAMLLACRFLGEPLTGKHVVGAALIVAGAVVLVKA